MKNKILGILLLVLSLSACTSSDLFDNNINYKNIKLELPPDLIKISTNDFTVLLDDSGVDDKSIVKIKSNLAKSLNKIHHIGNSTLIEIDASQSDLFKKVKDFWFSSRIPLFRFDKGTDVIETKWLEEKDNLTQDAIIRLLSRSFSPLIDNGKRDKFRTRIDYDVKKHIFI